MQAGLDADGATLGGPGGEPSDLWVFGYGSLMWRPGFPAQAAERARLNGYHRAFCVASTVHRGSPKRPGLVLGLDVGRSCEGVAYRVAAADVADVRRYLRARELISGVYREACVPLSLSDRPGTSVYGIAYIIERAHPSYVCVERLGLGKIAHIIRGARGQSGGNLDYLINTVRQLQAMGIRERGLERLVAVAAGHVAHAPAQALVRPTAEALRRVVAQKPDDVKRFRYGDRRRFLYRYRLGQG